MKVFKKTFLSMTLATALLAGHAATNDAQAVTFQPDPAVLDFGNVVVGTTKTISFGASWTLGAGETGSLNSAVTSSIANGFNVQRTNLGCATEGVDCTFEAMFTPTAGGPSVLNISQLLRVLIVAPNREFVLMPFQFKGSGVDVAAIPLPAAAPLMAGALGLLGLAGWRRRRVA